MNATIRNTNEQYGMAIEFSAATIDAAVADMQQTIRQCGPEFADVVVTDGDYEVVSDDTIPEIAAILIAQGPTFSGGTDELTREGAAEWDDQFDGDIDEITSWIEAGYWNPSTAATVRDEGHRPSDRPTIDGECAIYALCNHDVETDEVQW